MATKKKPADKAGETAAPKAKKDAVVDIFSVVDKQLSSQNLRNITLKKTTANDKLSTGILCLDLIMGGGHRGGRVTQIYGPAHSGKSSTAYTALAAILAMETPPLTAMYDYEGTTDAEYIQRLGVPLENMSKYFRYMKATNGPDMYKFLRNVAKGLKDKDDGPPQLVVFVDSVASMATADEMADDEEDNRLARRAVMHSTWWPRIKTLLSLKNISLVAINQIRANPSPYAPPQARPGGNAWEFNTDNLIKVKGGKKVMLRGEEYQPVTFSTEKNKNAVSGFEATVFLKLGQGFDPASDLIEFLTLTGLGRAAKESGRNVFVVDPRLAQMSKSKEELDGSYPIAAFENDLRSNADFNKAFRDAAFALLRDGTAFKLMQQHRIDTEIAKEQRAKDKAAKVASGEEVDDEEPKSKKAKKDKKPKAEAPAAAAEEDDEDETPAEFTFDDVTDDGDDDEEDAA